MPYTYINTSKNEHILPCRVFTEKLMAAMLSRVSLLFMEPKHSQNVDTHLPTSRYHNPEDHKHPF